MDLDTWRLSLWSQALGDDHRHLTGEIYKKWLSLRYKHLELTADIVTLLYELRRQYHLGVITNGPSTSQWEKIDRLKLRKHFDVILVSGDLPWEKPNRMIFQEACLYLGVEPNQCLMVGDKLETDILGGIDAKLAATVWIPLNQDNCDVVNSYVNYRPDYIIDHINELPRLLLSDSQIDEDNKPDLNDGNSNGSDGS